MTPRDRIRAFLKWWVTPIRRPGPSERRRDKPLLYIPFTIGYAALIWFYFYRYLAYDSIANKVGFWFSFIAWAIPPAVTLFVYRKAPTRRADRAGGRLVLAFGAIGIVLYVISTETSLIEPVIQSWFPGLFTGLCLGGDAGLLWKIHKGELAK